MPIKLNAGPRHAIQDEEAPPPWRSVFGESALIAFLAIFLLVALLLGGSWLYYYSAAMERWGNPASKLAVGETRIADIPSEFIRRSWLFAGSWDEIGECAKLRSKCDPAQSIALRDFAVKQDWPKLFDRLAIRDDWGDAASTSRSRDEFFSVLEAQGADKLRNHCLPVIKFETQSGGRGYYLVGYNCGGVEIPFNFVR